MPAHTHSFTPSGSVSTSVSVTSLTGTFYVNAGGTQTPSGIISFTGTSSSTAGTTGSSFRVNYSIDASHTHTATSTFYGTAGTTESTTPTGTFTGTAGTTSSVGSGTAFSILPPYIVKYCWERTA